MSNTKIWQCAQPQALASLAQDLLWAAQALFDELDFAVDEVDDAEDELDADGFEDMSTALAVARDLASDALSEAEVIIAELRDFEAVNKTAPVGQPEPALAGTVQAEI